jgi:hypothetical protein
MLGSMPACVETEEGARLTTHCLYPSFEPVHVFIAKVGNGYKVHDGGGAFDAAWLHGRDDSVITRAILTQCERFHLRVSDGSIVGSVDSADWLLNVVLGVANASSLAAHHAVARVIAAAEEALVVKIDRTLTEKFGEGAFRRGVDLTGKSGGKRHFDFALPLPGGDEVLINGVSPHKGSVSSKFVAFSDTEGDADHKFAVFDRELASEDAALLGQVASIVPLVSLPPLTERVMAYGR